mmetsp:Transcript_32509/g.48460  ORF Transcript_32509/g.48460 Transcript_32509/m.48460 type:complete len:147 (-) Transcript_32509:348-788(-)
MINNTDLDIHNSLRNRNEKSYVPSVTAAAGAPLPNATCQPLNRRCIVFLTPSCVTEDKTVSENVSNFPVCINVFVVSNGKAATQKPIPARAPAPNVTEKESLAPLDVSGAIKSLPISNMTKNDPHPRPSRTTVTPAPRQSPDIPCV